MELDNIYTNMNYDHLKQDRKQQNLKSDRGGVQSTESVRGKWSSLVIYILLGVSILLSVVMLITAVILFTQLFTIMKMLETDFKMGLAQLQHNVTVLSSDMKTLETDFKMDLAQVQNNVTQLFTIMKMLETDFKMGLAQLQHNVTVLSSDMKTLETDFKMDLAQVQNNVTQLFTIMKMLETDFKMGLAQLQHNELSGGCPEDWRRFQQNCYYFSSESKTWKEAQRACRSLDANLVVINKPEEQAFIKTWFQRKNRWIGLTDSISEGDWRWVDGMDYTSSVKFWATGEPNNKSNEDCAEIHRDGEWNDLPCDSSQPWICEKPAQFNCP
ncbi:C-type lectin domain family 10 member A-like isoform X2 [Hemiscyllium ocellatum]|uniref:C-type lectin domain family 10 member A-like isoform X2 n=1 Tax=Hemiscyllium ocellatum TaxID=170820 RepID=UPI002967685A|nr:C-type lectin domain family 10 member A-like isoform X2 [Hemiscyllium ocellatum]